MTKTTACRAVLGLLTAFLLMFGIAHIAQASYPGSMPSTVSVTCSTGDNECWSTSIPAQIMNDDTPWGRYQCSSYGVPSSHPDDVCYATADNWWMIYWAGVFPNHWAIWKYDSASVWGSNESSVNDLNGTYDQVSGGTHGIPLIGSGTPPAPTSSITMLTPSATYLYNGVPVSGYYTVESPDYFDEIIFNAKQTDMNVSINIPDQFIVNSSPPPTYPVSFSFSLTLPYQGNYSLEAYLYNSVTASTSDVSNLLIFGIGTTTFSTSTDTQPGMPAPNYLSCATLDVGCYFKNALTWAFTPNGSGLNNLTGLGDKIKTKPPFGYLKIMTDGLQTIDPNATSSISFNIPTYIMTLFFTPIRTGLTWILYIFLAVVIIKRLEHAQI